MQSSPTDLRTVRTSVVVDGVCVCCRLMRRPASHEESVLELQQQLHEKDMKLTDIRLEALSSAHQLEQLRDTMNQMKVGPYCVLFPTVIVTSLRIAAELKQLEGNIEQQGMSPV